MINLELKIVAAKYNEVDNRLPAALGSSIERNVKKVINSRKSPAQIAEVVIDNAGVTAPTAALAKLKQRKYTDEVAKIEERCSQYVEARMKLYPVAASHPSEIGKKLPTDISDDVETSPRTYPAATSRNNKDHCNPRHAQSARESGYKTYNVNNYDYIDQPLDVPSLTVIRPVNEMFANIVDHHSCRLTKKSARYDNNVSSELSKMTRNTAVQMKERTFSVEDAE